MELSARGAQKTRNESVKLPMFSKQWLPGDTLRVFYPIFWVDGKPEIAVGAIWGHSVSDIKGLGLKTAFIPSTTQFDSNAQPIGVPDITYQFSQIAKLFVDGQKALEEAEIMKKNWPTEAMRKEALKTLEEKYDTKNNMKAVKPLIGKAQYYISTEVVSVKTTPTGIVDDSIIVSSAPLSNQTINRLYALLDDPKYAPTEGETFFEVEWKYPTDPDKAKAARGATPNGLTAEYRLQVTNPESYVKVSSFFAQVSKNAESITRRATRTVDPARVQQALTQYSFMNANYIDEIPEEDEEVLLKHVQLVNELAITRGLSNAELITKINDALSKAQALRPNLAPELPTPDIAVANNIPENTASALETATSEVESSASAVLETPVVPDVTVPDINPSAPDLQSLLNNPSNAGDNAGLLEDINLEGM